MYENVSKLENVIFSSGYFQISNVILLGGTNGKDGTRLQPIRSYEYASDKHPEISKLKNLSLSQTNDYLVFTFKGMVDGKFVVKDIFSSYPNFEDVKSFFINTYQAILSNQDKYFTNTGLVEGEPEYFVSQPLAAQKTLVATPYKIKRENSYANGILLYIDDEHSVQLDVNALWNIINRLDYFNLSTESLILKLGMMNIDNGGTPAPSNRAVNSTLPNRNTTVQRPSTNRPSTNGARNTSLPSRNTTVQRPSSQPPVQPPVVADEVEYNGLDEIDVDAGTTTNSALQSILASSSEVNVESLLDELD